MLWDLPSHGINVYGYFLISFGLFHLLPPSPPLYFGYLFNIVLFFFLLLHADYLIPAVYTNICIFLVVYSPSLARTKLWTQVPTYTMD